MALTTSNTKPQIWYFCWGNVRKLPCHSDYLWWNDRLDAQYSVPEAMARVTRMFVDLHSAKDHTCLEVMTLFVWAFYSLVLPWWEPFSDFQYFWLDPYWMTLKDSLKKKKKASEIRAEPKIQKNQEAYKLKYQHSPICPWQSPLHFHLDDCTLSSQRIGIALEGEYSLTLVGKCRHPSHCGSELHLNAFIINLLRIYL